MDKGGTICYLTKKITKIKVAEWGTPNFFWTYIHHVIIAKKWVLHNGDYIEYIIKIEKVNFQAANKLGKTPPNYVCEFA